MYSHSFSSFSSVFYPHANQLAQICYPSYTQVQLSVDLSTYSTDWRNKHRAADGHLHYFLLHHCCSEDMAGMQNLIFLDELDF